MIKYIDAFTPHKHISKKPIDKAIIHCWTIGKNRDIKTTEEIIEVLKNPFEHPLIKAKISYKEIIDQDGSIYIFMDENQTANHAGFSKWGELEYLNRKTHGLCLIRNEDEQAEQQYTDLQYKALGMRLRELKVKEWTSHREIRKQWNSAYPDRKKAVKTDPDNFNFKRLDLYFADPFLN